MGINSINSSDIGSVNSNISTGEIKKDSTFGKISAGSLGPEKPSLDVKDNVKGSNIKEHSLAEALETVTTEDVQNTVEIKKTPSGGMLGGFKIGAGKSSGTMKNSIGNGGNVKNSSLENHV
ncbi:MAG: hypothetical protein LBD60_04525 [Puniceicoccales bacterium]|jgi:hypothetical protein|nr:hypothetical protein [Puniceicoccales bacterium]